MGQKPLVSTVIVLGTSRGPRFENPERVLWGQTRSFYGPNGEPLRGSPGERSIFGKHFKEGVDTDSRDTALRCAKQEFWINPAPLTREDFIAIVSGVETDKSVNDVFLFRRHVRPEDLDIGEGDGLLRIPLTLLPLYIRDGHLTEASIKTLEAAGDIEKLWQRLG